MIQDNLAIIISNWIRVLYKAKTIQSAWNQSYTPQYQYLSTRKDPLLQSPYGQLCFQFVQYSVTRQQCQFTKYTSYFFSPKVIAWWNHIYFRLLDHQIYITPAPQPKPFSHIFHLNGFTTKVFLIEMKMIKWLLFSYLISDKKLTKFAS